MYKNPLNNGKISDYNSLKNQRDNATIIKKYENKKIQTEPTELQKYYQYLTYQQPILDELNYVAERMRNEDIKTKTDDYNFVEDLKIKRENQMKEDANREEDIKNDIRSDLFDYSSTVKQDDMTPIINTDVELETPSIIEQQQQEVELNLISDLFGGDLFGGDLFDDNPPIKEEIFELKKTEEKISKSKKKREGRKKAKEIMKDENNDIFDANDLMSNADTVPIKEEKISKAKKKREGRKKAKEEIKREGEFFELSRKPEKKKKSKK
jgi:hypothetical protein